LVFIRKSSEKYFYQNVPPSALLKDMYCEKQYLLFADQVIFWKITDIPMSEQNNGADPNDPLQQHAARYDYLMDRYLAREASEPEKEELKRLTEHGFKDRFLERFDEVYHSDGQEQMPDKVRREVLTNILGETKIRPVMQWWRWAAAAIVLLGVAGWLSVRHYWSGSFLPQQYAVEQAENKMLVFRGKQFLHLPDGSSVLLNAESELSYSPVSFESGSREVKLKGEAYFDIAFDPSSAFKVKTGTVVTRVLGTAFNVNMQDEKVVVTVTRGLVEVSNDNRVLAQLKPDQQITVNTELDQFNTSVIPADEEITWKKSFLVFDNIDLEEAGRLIEEHYGVTLDFTNSELKKCRITASFLNDEDLGVTMKVLSEMVGATYSIVGNNVSINGGSCD
jgi:transmembrane sensor